MNGDFVRNPVAVHSTKRSARKEDRIEPAPCKIFLGHCKEQLYEIEHNFF